MSRAPQRDKVVHFLGAGFAKGFGLPLTSELVTRLLGLSKRTEGDFLNVPEALTERLQVVFAAFYPDGEHPGFQPNVVDFFLTLTTYGGTMWTGVPNRCNDLAAT